MAILEIVEGYHKGKTLSFEGSATLGRSPNNTLCLYDARASRQHAVIRSATEEGYIVSDLGSGNGTFVNDERLKTNVPRTLKGGDLLSIGSTRILFTCEQTSLEQRPQLPKASPATALLMNDSALSVVMESGDDMTDLAMDTIDATSALCMRQDEERDTIALQRLEAMIQLANHLAEVAEQEALLDRVMLEIFELFPKAERAFILMRSAGQKALVPAIGRNRNETGQPEEFAISNTIINKVVEEKKSVLTSDATKEIDDSKSIAEMKIRSLMCVPLLYKDEVLGVINVDNTSSDACFERVDLTLLTGIAAQAAAALKTAALHDQIESEVQMRSQLSRYMSPDVAKSVADGKITATLGGKRTTGTLLISSVNDVESMAEDLPPEAFIDTLSRFYRILDDVVARSSGTLNRFGGDMFMAFWDVMFPDKEPQKHALVTALQMQAAIWYFDLDLKSEARPALHMGMGLHSGPVTAGNIGDSRVEYTVIGKGVSIATAAQQLAGPWQVFLTDGTFNAIAADCSAIQLPSIELHGESHSLFSVRSFRTSKERLIASIPVKILDRSGNLLGDGLITSADSAGNELRICFASESILVAGQPATLVLDIPELNQNHELSGIVEDETRETYYGQTSFSKSTLCAVQADASTLALMQAGTCIKSTQTWEAIRNQRD